MSYLFFSKDHEKVVETRDEMTAEEALKLLVTVLLGDDYYVTDPVHSTQANVIIVEDILKTYKPKRRFRK